MTTHIISVGGGFTSTIELPLEVLKNHYKRGDKVHMVIAALAGESPDLWRLVAECERLTGQSVTRVAWQKRKQWQWYGLERAYWVNAPEWAWNDIWDVFNHVGRMGSSLVDPCSANAKRLTLRNYLLDYFNPSDSVLYVGITAHEIDRMMAIHRNWNDVGMRVEAPLCDLNLQGSSGERCQAFLSWQPLAYLEGHDHNNCDRFCVKAGHAQMARLLWYARDVYLHHERREIEFQQQFNTTATIMRDRKTIAGKVESTPLTLREFRERMEAKWRGLLPGFDPFEALEDTPACTFCESVA